MRVKTIAIGLCRDNRASVATEFVVLLVLVACFVIAGARAYGQTVATKFQWADQRVAKFVTF
ncbi:MAG: hypothetical protein R3E66_12830 [bacterium]